ncbi:MAG: Carboxyl-terminal protease [Candidatus Doudnabacteria bacterium Gr01-1014_77]|uniref:Carboxyl-terminal protease n=1 Tax=Candidatus Doudnabacteria bacterium Gr01-1014_77 TaxID=2017133 RepID=A0A554JBV0_9BACT|nr:MAG: Carboxyl-terminal protease [Candidatus Doudnabacteria bacterium Gr01-1014_77]
MISNKKYIITILALLVFSTGTFFSGLQLGSKGYTYSGGDYKIINQNNYPKDVDYSLLWQTLDIVNQKYIDKPIDQQKILYGAVAGAVSAIGDPYTAFFDPKQYSDFKTELSGSFDGIGAEVGMKDGNVVVVAPLDDTPAKKAGILSGDIILKVDSKETTGMTLDEVVSNIRGPRGTEVQLNIFRPGTQKLLDFKITRAKIEITSVKTEYKEVDGKKIAVINIQRFGDDTNELFREAAMKAVADNVSGIVLDLRDDPGGYLEGAVNISSYWLEKGQTVVTEAHSNGTVQKYTSTGNNILSKIKTVILANGGSASASEIVSGALRDQGYAKIVGVKTFGKGSVQELIGLPQNTAVKVTVAKWLTPNGVNINKNGLEPDVKVEMSAEDITNQKDPQMDKALEIVSK